MSYDTQITGDGTGADTYTVFVAPASGYRVAFHPVDALVAYYKVDETTGTSHCGDATLVNANSDVAGINITISTGNSISGRVTDGSGSGISDAWVNAWSESTGQGAGGTTDSDGYFQFQATPALDYRVNVWKEGYAPQIYCNTADWALATLVDVSSADQQNINFVLSTGKTISGTITDGSSVPIPGIWVNAWSESTGSSSGAQTDSDGNYTIPGLVCAADFRVDVNDDNYIHKLYKTGGLGTSNWEDTTLVDTTAGNAVNINIQLSTGGTISGTITNLGNGEKVWINAWSETTWAGDGVELWNNGGTYYQNGQSVGETGTYTIKRLDNSVSDYKVNVWSDGKYQNVFYKQGGGTTINSMEAAKLDVSSVNIDIALSAGKTISGTISGLNGECVSISAYSDSTGSNGYVERTGNGTYTISGLASASDFRVDARADNYTHLFYNATCTSDKAVLVDTTAANSTGIDFALSAGKSISGSITGLGDGERAWINAWSDTLCSGAGVEIYNNNGTYILNGDWSNKNTTGSYTVSGLSPEADYRLEVWSDSYMHVFYDETNAMGTANWKDTTLIDISTADATGKDITLGVGGSITGTVTGLDNGETAWINVWNPILCSWGGAEIIGTGSDVNFIVKSLGPGDGYIVETFSANHPHYFYKEGVAGHVVLDGNVSWAEQTEGDEIYWVPNSADITKVSVAQSSTTALQAMALNTITSYALTFKVAASGGLEPGTNLWADVCSEATGASANQDVLIDEDTETVTISGIVPGDDYRLEIWSNKYVHAFYNNDASSHTTSDWSQSTVLDFSTGDVDLSFNTIMLSTGNSISGTVTVNGSPKGGLWVDASSSITGVGNGAVTDVAGKYKIEGLPAANDYQVTVCGSGGCADLSDVDIAGGDVTGQDLAIGGGSIDISGTVDLTGTADESGAIVALFSDSGTMFVQAMVTPATGNYLFENLSNSSYIVKVDYDADGNYDKASGTITSTTVNVDFAQ